MKSPLIAVLFLIGVVHFSAEVSAAQNDDAASLVKRITRGTASVRDYSVQTTITPKLPMINVQPLQATLYFKQKDKYRFVTPGIAVLPKQGFSDLARLLSNVDLFSPLITGKENVGGVATSVITLLPTVDTMDVVVAKLWVDPATALVHKAQITTKSSGTVGVRYAYGAESSKGLPRQVVFTVDMKKFKIPKGVATDLNRKKSSSSKDEPASSGTITVDFRDYRINKGVDDAVFTK
jgi:hypothetical protein